MASRESLRASLAELSREKLVERALDLEQRLRETEERLAEAQAQIAELRRQRFGRKAEKLSPEQQAQMNEGTIQTDAYEVYRPWSVRMRLFTASPALRTRGDCSIRR